MPDLIKVIILGIVEGVTEFLPISSTGHLIVASAALDFTIIQGTFEIFIQLGAVFAVVGFYWSDLFTQVRTVRSDRHIQRLWLGIFLAFVPAALLGILIKDWIQDVLFSPGVVAVSLIVGGVIFLLVERRPQAEQHESTTQELTQVTPRQAVIVGLAQMTALIPGVSRSGASIIGGLLSGMNRQVATQFSFFLAIPTLGAATIYDLLTSLDQLSGSDLVLLFIGAVISGIVAWISIKWLLRFVAHNNFNVFGYYRIAAGLIILLFVAAGRL